MGKDNLIQLRNTLLQGGVAYKHVKRFIGELKDHSADLEREATNNGSDLLTAKGEANTRIGDPELLVQEMLQRPELKSYAARYPKTCKIFAVVLPVFSYFLMNILLILAIIGIAELIGSGSTDNSELITTVPSIFVFILTIVKYFVLYITPLILIFTLIPYAVHNQLELKYYGLGILVMALLSSSVFVSLIWPDPINEIQGSINVSISIVRGDFPNEFFWRMLATLLVVFGCKNFMTQKMQSEFE